MNAYEVATLMANNGFDWYRVDGAIFNYYRVMGRENAMTLVSTIAEHGEQAIVEFFAGKIDELLKYRIVKQTINDADYGRFPRWIVPVSVTEKSLFDYTGWKQVEYRGTFKFDGRFCEGLFISHYHADQGGAIESIFWTMED